MPANSTVSDKQFEDSTENDDNSGFTQLIKPLRPAKAVSFQDKDLAVGDTTERPVAAAPSDLESTQPRERKQKRSDHAKTSEVAPAEEVAPHKARPKLPKKQSVQVVDDDDDEIVEVQAPPAKKSKRHEVIDDEAPYVDMAPKKKQDAPRNKTQAVPDPIEAPVPQRASNVEHVVEEKLQRKKRKARTANENKKQTSVERAKEHGKKFAKELTADSGDDEEPEERHEPVKAAMDVVEDGETENLSAMVRKLADETKARARKNATYARNGQFTPDRRRPAASATADHDPKTSSQTNQPESASQTIRTRNEEQAPSTPSKRSHITDSAHVGTPNTSRLHQSHHEEHVEQPSSATKTKSRPRPDLIQAQASPLRPARPEHVHGASASQQATSQSAKSNAESEAVIQDLRAQLAAAQEELAKTKADAKAQAKAAKQEIARQTHQAQVEAEVNALLERELTTLRDAQQAALEEHQTLLAESDARFRKAMDRANRNKETARMAATRLQEIETEVEDMEKAHREAMQHKIDELLSTSTNLNQVTMELSHTLEQVAALTDEHEALKRELEATRKAEKAQREEEKAQREALQLRIDELQKNGTHIDQANLELSQGVDQITALTEQQEALKRELKLTRQASQTSEETIQAAVKNDAMYDHIVSLQERLLEAQQQKEQVEADAKEKEATLQSEKQQLQEERDLASQLVANQREELARQQETIESITSKLFSSNSGSRTCPSSSTDTSLQEVDLGPLSRFLSMKKTADNAWVLRCTNPSSKSEVQFKLSLVDEDNLEYYPLAFKDKKTASNASEIPEWLCQPIYFHPAGIGPFLGKMLTFLYRSQKKAAASSNKD